MPLYFPYWELLYSGVILFISIGIMLKKILFRDNELVYEIKGTGVPVMLVHGFTEDRRIWDSLLSGIENKYRWIIPDLPGSGNSAYNSSLKGLNEFAECIGAILENENIMELVLIGHSM